MTTLIDENASGGIPKQEDRRLFHAVDMSLGQTVRASFCFSFTKAPRLGVPGWSPFSARTEGQAPDRLSSARVIKERAA